MAIDVDSTQRPLIDPATEEKPNGPDADIGNEPDDLTATQQSGFRAAIIFGLLTAIVLASLVGWLEYRAAQTHRTEQQRDRYLQAARQSALNLTTINYTRVDADVQRILDAATGTFHDDFQSRAQPFIDVVKQARSISEGSITEAGLESQDSDQAEALVAVTVKTSLAGSPDQQPRAWRMRIGVQSVGNTVKASHVEFVP